MRLHDWFFLIDCVMVLGMLVLATTLFIFQTNWFYVATSVALVLVAVIHMTWAWVERMEAGS